MSGKMKLVDAHAVRELLNDNVDEHVSHFIVFTDHGTLLSHTSALSEPSLLKFPPFAGTVWRNHNSHIVANGDGDLAAGRIAAMKTLSLEVVSKGKGLRQMTVEMDGVVSVVRVIVPRLLVAAQMARARVDGEDDEGGFDRGEGAEVSRDGDGCDSESDSEMGGEATGEAGDDSIADSDSGEGSDQSEETGTQTRGVSRMRVLELKAEGMAEFLAQEYPSRLPNDFF